MRPRNLFSLRIADQADRTDSDKSSHPTDKDNRIKPTFPIDGNSCQRSQRHRQIDCQTVKPHSFTTPGGRDHINRNRIAGNRSQPHKTTLNETAIIVNMVVAIRYPPNMKAKTKKAKRYKGLREKQSTKKPEKGRTQSKPIV
jgi:hypothetical protein